MMAALFLRGLMGCIYRPVSGSNLNSKGMYPACHIGKMTEVT